VYTGVKEDGKALDVVTPSSRTRVIAGVTTRVVEDRLYLDNVLEERTSDYYAQDSCGNVWYFGEDTAELDANGTVVSTDGSWHAGVDGAQPGLIMQEEPTVGRRFRQEFLSGEAEDTFKVLSLSASVKVPAGAFAGAMRTRETTALEPGVLDNKYYVRGIGEVEEITVRVRPRRCASSRSSRRRTPVRAGPGGDRMAQGARGRADIPARMLCAHHLPPAGTGPRPRPRGGVS
jgi:hypothetical protein